MEISKAQISIENHLSTVERDGVLFLIDYLQNTDFYTAPASVDNHLACRGGLATHTLNVLECALFLRENHDLTEINEESVILTAVCHDLCKVNFYEINFDPITDAQNRFLTQLLAKNGLTRPMKVDKGYASILIDFLKNKYEKGMDLPEYAETYSVKDQFPCGHGDKSAIIANRLVDLTNNELLAIRWHMGAFDLNFASPFQRIPYMRAVKETPLVGLLQIADMSVTLLKEE